MLKLSLVSLSLFLPVSLVARADRAVSARSSVALQPSASATASYPSVIEPRLPHVDRIVNVMRARVADHITAEVDLCVSTAGSVTQAVVRRGSGFATIDVALVRDLATWKFEVMPGPTSVQICDRTTIVYRVARD
ncbi:MAG: hypothetical protein WKG01_23055 [Kofleriaceae bacterium]